MSIYTKTGDGGTTALFGGKRVLKSDNRVDAYGSIDELTSVIGMIIAHIDDTVYRDHLTHMQRNLYRIMARLSGASISVAFLSAETAAIEKLIDTFEKKLPPLTHFILPQGGETASWCHMARTVCRRAERAVVKLKIENGASASPAGGLKIIQYLNRLSDFFFVLARAYNTEKEITV